MQAPPSADQIAALPHVRDLRDAAGRLMLQGQWLAALQTAQAGLADCGQDPDLWELVASCASALQDSVLAELAWTQVLAARPDALIALNNLGMLLDAQRRYAEATEIYRRALVLAPQDPLVLSNYGLLLEHTGQIEAAAQVQQCALDLSPGSPQILSNLAGVKMLQGRELEAEQYYRAALMHADSPDILCNLGILLSDQGRFEEAEQVLRHALALEANHIAAQTSLAQLLLCQGRLTEGWRYFEARRTVANLSSWFQAEPSRQSCRRWQGEALTGKAILVLPEQGFGDEIQFARYLEWLKELGPRSLTLICRDEQKTLFDSLKGPDRVIGLSAAATHCDDYDFWTVLMSLPGLLGEGLASLPARIPYLQAPAERIARWRTRLPQDGLRVGIVWQGNPAHSNDAERSLPGVQMLAPLWQVEGVHFVSLQVLPEGTPVETPGPCINLGPDIQDFADTAAILVQLDLLICVDTSVAHLAGALGVPCWVMLPACKTDWRWLIGRDDSPWYPSLRLFRQPQRADWTTVLEALQPALTGFSQGRSVCALPEISASDAA